MTDDAQLDIYRLLYRSRSAMAGSDEAVDVAFSDILATSRRNNARDHVTGALMFTSSMFIQALEGPRCALEATFERICCDLRHIEVEIIEYAAAPGRAFDGWSLHELRSEPAVEALFLQLAQGSTAEMDASGAAFRAVELLSTFAKVGRSGDGRYEEGDRSRLAKHEAGVNCRAG